MNILHLKYAVEVEKAGGITQAAENLHMGQPNLSKAIKDLENSVGLSIFKRTSKGVEPTIKGAEFLAYTKSLLFKIEEMETLYRQDKSHKISFSISIPRASYITHAFTKFINSLDMTKEIDIDFLESGSMDTIHGLMQGEYKLGIIRYQTIYEKYFLNLLFEKGIAFEEIWEFECLILMSKEHPLAFSEEIKGVELGEYVEITHGDITVPSISFSEQKKNREKHSLKRISVYERGSQFDLLREVPLTYMWVSPLPQKVLDAQGLVLRKCKVLNNHYKDVVIRLKDYKLSEIDEMFLLQLRKEKNELVTLQEPKAYL